MYEAWERFKELLRLCPHHEIPRWMLIQSFYDGLTDSLQSMVNSAAGRTIMNKTPNESWDFFKQIANNGQRRTSTDGFDGKHQIDALTSLTAQMEALTREANPLRSSPRTSNNVYSEVQAVEQHEDIHEVNYAGAYKQNNAYANTYNPG
ncbi:hypothetical protein MLD38_037692 [Melastoma candidum]|uniref:Uncharacterized protein n=1 Tax=Melastoma candidum TaxID=119954 RepID=A0ACB9LP72_9MYRT|nr:hypothetical protein MLD38_037692 [Melastoma candidum]